MIESSRNQVNIALQTAQHGIPRHVAIIMDGNRRWARQRGLPVAEGHRRGVDALKETIRAAVELEIAYLTVWAFSTDNWKRSKPEVEGLMSLLRFVLKRDLAELHEKGICVKFIGDRRRLDVDIMHLLESAEALTENNRKITLIIALNYGFRTDLVQAVQSLALRVTTGDLKLEELNEQSISASLSTAQYPDPDLLIRTSGEKRLSNYLLWELAYAELYFSDVYWPEFNKDELLKALHCFSQRQRRLGGN